MTTAAAHQAAARILLASVGVWAASCSDPAVDPGVEPTPSELEGTWTGSGTFQQTVGGDTATVQVLMNLTFDERGAPDSLPALGIVSPWRMYVSGRAVDRSPLKALEMGGTIYAFCPWEADGPANAIHVVPGANAAGVARWEYEATYRFADLIKYELYDYDRPDAPEVKLVVVDSYRLLKAGGGDRLVVAGRAAGATVSSQQPVALRFDAQLGPGKSEGSFGCRLAPPR